MMRFVDELEESELAEFARKLAKIVQNKGMKIASCAEMIDLASCGVEHSSCIDKNLIDELVGGIKCTL